MVQVTEVEVLATGSTTTNNDCMPVTSDVVASGAALAVTPAMRLASAAAFMACFLLRYSCTSALSASVR